MVRDDVRGLRVAEDLGGSATGVLLTRRLEGGAQPTGASCPLVVFGPLAGGRGSLVG